MQTIQEKDLTIRMAITKHTGLLADEYLILRKSHKLQGEAYAVFVMWCWLIGMSKRERHNYEPYKMIYKYIRHNSLTLLSVCFNKIQQYSFSDSERKLYLDIQKTFHYYSSSKFIDEWKLRHTNGMFNSENK